MSDNPDIIEKGGTRPAGASPRPIRALREPPSLPRKGHVVGVGAVPTSPPLRSKPLFAEDIARRFHETYERLAPSFGYQTRSESAVPWDEVPEPNRLLMIATIREVFSLPADAAPDGATPATEEGTT